MKSSRWLKLGTMAALVVGLANCGGGSSTPTSVTPTPTPTPTPVPSVRTLISQGSSEAWRELLHHTTAPIAVQAQSDLELIVDWTFADSNMFTFIVSDPVRRRRCSTPTSARSCSSPGGTTAQAP